MNKSGWWKVLLWTLVVLLPGTMLLLPLVLVVLARRRAPAESPALAPVVTASLVPAPLESPDLAPASSRAIQLASI